MSKHQANSALPLNVTASSGQQNGSTEGTSDVAKSVWGLPYTMTGQGDLSQEISDAFANLEVQASLPLMPSHSPQDQTSGFSIEHGLFNGAPVATDRFGADLDHELNGEEVVSDFGLQHAVQDVSSGEGAGPVRFTDKYERGEVAMEYLSNQVSIPSQPPFSPHLQQQPVIASAEKTLGHGSSTQSGFNTIGSQPRKHNQWHGGGRAHGTAGGNRGPNSQQKAGAGSAFGGKGYQTRAPANGSGVAGAKKSAGGNSANGGIAQQRIATGNVRRKAKNNPVPPLEDASSSSLQAEPSGWGDLPSPKSVNVDTGTSAWGAPPSDTKDIHSGAGWGEKGSWSSRPGGRDDSDSTGTQAAGWHGSKAGWSVGKMAADVQVAKLMEMGFNREDVVKALSSNSLNFESALGDLLASNVEDCAIDSSPSAQPTTSNSTFAAAANSVAQHHLSANSNGRKQPTQSNFLPSKTQPHGAVLQGLPSSSNVGTQVAWPTAQPGVLAVRNPPIVSNQTQLPPHNNTKLRTQLLQQQQLNQQMALLQLQLSRMPPPVANIRLQIAHFQVLSQQLAQQQQQLKSMVHTPQVIAQQQQVTQQQFQVNQIIQHLQQQLVVALKQHPTTLKGVAPGINPTLAHQQAAIQGLLAAGQPLGGVNSAITLKPVTGVPMNSGWTVPHQPGLLPTQLSLPQKDTRSSVGTMENTTSTAASKALPSRSLSAPSAPIVAESNSKRALPKIDARFFPDTIPEFQPGKPWQPRPKPTEPAQVYGNGTSTAPVLEASPTKVNSSSASNSSTTQPKKLSAEAKPFTLQKWNPPMAKAEEMEAPQKSEPSSSSTPSEPPPATQTPQSTKRPQQLTFVDDDDILGPAVPSYGLSKTPLTSMWSVSSPRKNSKFADTNRSLQGNDDSSAMPTTSFPSKEETADPPLSSPSSDKAHMKDVPSTGLWNHEGLTQGKIHSPELSFAEWQAGKKAHLTVFKLPTNPPSAWLLVQRLPLGVDQEEVKATCSEYGEPLSFFLNEAESSALVHYQSKEQAMHAKTGLDKTLLNGLCISTDFASDSDIKAFIDACNNAPSDSSVPTFGPLEGVDSTGLTSPSSLLYPEDCAPSCTPRTGPVSPVTQVASVDNPPIERPVSLASEEVKLSAWEGPPIDIPKSQVSQLWPVGDFNSLLGYNAPTPTTPDADDWSHISSSPSLTKFLPGGLF